MNKSTFTKWEQWVYVVVIVCIFAFFYFTSPNEIEFKENISSVEVKMYCSDPFFNVSDGYWYCNLDDFNYSEVRS